MLPTKLDVRNKLSECFECWRRVNYPSLDKSDEDKTLSKLSIKLIYSLKFTVNVVVSVDFGYT